MRMDYPACERGGRNRNALKACRVKGLANRAEDMFPKFVAQAVHPGAAPFSRSGAVGLGVGPVGISGQGIDRKVTIPAVFEGVEVFRDLEFDAKLVDGLLQPEGRVILQLPEPIVG